MNAAAARSLELTLLHDGVRWRATGAGIDDEHTELAELDRLILNAAAHASVNRVHVRFDSDRLPAWLRQYQPHYFNYVLTTGSGTRA